jgi:predicted house-cleaning noncanonical NTP pyrophosphatase (MazG superfamily)
MIDKNLLRQKLAELIIELTDADLGEVSNIYEAIEQIINECEVTS